MGSIVADAILKRERQITELIAERDALKAEVEAARRLLDAIRFGTKLYVDGGLIIRTSKESEGEWKSQPSGSKSPDWKVYPTVRVPFRRTRRRITMTDKTIQLTINGGEPINTTISDAFQKLVDVIDSFANENDEQAAELKELREFVGAIRRVDLDRVTGRWLLAGSFAFIDGEMQTLATGTDPFDAWRKIGESR